MVVIHTGIFGGLNEFVNAQTDDYIQRGLLFIAIIYFLQDMISYLFLSTVLSIFTVSFTIAWVSNLH